jgi:hypothetical protein
LNSAGTILRVASGDDADCLSGTTLSCGEPDETGRRRPVARSPEIEPAEESRDMLPAARSRIDARGEA